MRKPNALISYCSIFILVIILLSNIASAVTFVIPHDDEIYQVQDMKEEGTAQQVAAFESTLEQLQAEIQMLLVMIDGQRAFDDRFLYGQWWRRNYYHSDARYRSCVRDLVDDQYDLLRDAAKSGVEISDKDLADFRNQERRCRKYARRSSYLDWVSGMASFTPFSPVTCRWYDPLASSASSSDDFFDYVDWRRACGRRSGDFYDSFFDSYAGWPMFGGYTYGDDITHPYYYGTAGYVPPFYGLAGYGSPFMPTSAVLTYDSPSYYLSADIPGLTRPYRGPLSYSPEAYTEWKNNCENTVSIDGRLSKWCAETIPYWT